jgi:hypothetical protein
VIPRWRSSLKRASTISIAVTIVIWSDFGISANKYCDNVRY